MKGINALITGTPESSRSTTGGYSEEIATCHSEVGPHQNQTMRALRSHDSSLQSCEGQISVVYEPPVYRFLLH